MKKKKKKKKKKKDLIVISSVFHPTLVNIDDNDLENVFKIALLLVAVLLNVLYISICTLLLKTDC